MRVHDLVAAVPGFGVGMRCLRCGWRSDLDATDIDCGDPIRCVGCGCSLHNAATAVCFACARGQARSGRPAPIAALLVALNEVELLNLGSLDDDQLDQLDAAVKRTMEGALRLLFKVSLERSRRKSDAPAGHSRPVVVDPPS
jgi:hypothetical protein